jgi:hypothetical protein
VEIEVALDGVADGGLGHAPRVPTTPPSQTSRVRGTVGRRGSGYRCEMTTTPEEPLPDPEVVPSGDPTPIDPGDPEPRPETEPPLP